ncbi:MAG: CoA-binding protein [Armatimonadota bacterium]
MTPAEILKSTHTIAVVGFSEDEGKAGHYVPAYLQKRGYRIIPVNPKVAEAWGERGYAALTDIPEPVDLVVVFRRSEYCADVVRDALAMPHRPRAVWLQSGITSAEARRLAEEAGIVYIEDRCAMVEHRRMGAP